MRGVEQPSYWKGKPVGLRGGVPMWVGHGANDTVNLIVTPPTLSLVKQLISGTNFKTKITQN